MKITSHKSINVTVWPSKEEGYFDAYASIERADLESWTYCGQGKSRHIDKAVAYALQQLSSLLIERAK